MSRNFWTCNEDEFKKNISNLSVEECEKLADYFLNSILEKVQSEDHPNSKQVVKIKIIITLKYIQISKTQISWGKKNIFELQKFYNYTN